MKKLRYSLRSNRIDIFGFLLAIGSALIAYRYAQNQQLLLIFGILIPFILLTIVIYSKIKDKPFYFISLTDRKEKDDWIGRGQFEYSRVNNCFQITKADPGCIYSKCLNWDNYKYGFDFKIRKACLGVILRAVNLSNYIMMQITEKGVRPHIRINGAWTVWESESVNLVFPKNLLLESWYKCEFVCDKETINVRIYNENKKILDREWEIPQGSLTFPFKREENDPKPITIPFAINLEYGSVGFRNSGNEKALVKNVLIEKI